MTIRHRTTMVLLLAGSLLLAGCLTTGVGDGPGDDAAGAEDDDHHDDGHDHGTSDHHDDADGHHDHDDPEPMAGFTGEEDRIVNVTGGEPSEFRFSPASLTVTEGEVVGVRFTNAGDAEHELAIPALDLHAHAGPGETVEFSFTAPGNGTYEFGCYLPGHYEAGMHGELVVE